MRKGRDFTTLSGCGTIAPLPGIEAMANERPLAARIEQAVDERFGARVTVAFGESRQVAWQVGGGSYLSASDPRLRLRAQVNPASAAAWPSRLPGAGS